MKGTFALVLSLMFLVSQGQTFSGKVANHTKGDMDVVLTLFGMDKPVKIGTLDANGNLKIDFSSNPAENLSEDEAGFFIDRLVYGFEYVCGNPDDFPEGEPKIARSAGFIALWANDQWSGTLFPVTNEKLKFWLEDNGYNDAVEASYYRVLLVTEDVNLSKKCNNSDFYEGENVEVNIEYDIRLKKGLNMVEYQIQSVFKTDPEIRASFPDKVKITNHTDNPPIIWLANYFW